ncbi:MAG TPA: glycosyltransferase family 4 protein [Candidatus Acidoferrales bacterium]|nr:glycosyltransferase family 4 protein [Candidatus Acidoferrales bacterium]
MNSYPNKPRIAVVMPAFLKGGAEATCAWTLQSLRNDYDLTLATLMPTHASELNAPYGTSLNNDDYRILCPWSPRMNPGLRFLFGTIRPLHALRQQFLARYVRARRSQFDLAISTFNEMDLGAPAIQFIHFPSFVRNRLYEACAGSSGSRIRSNVTLVPSQFIQAIVEQRYGIRATVLYPPARDDFAPEPWNDRDETILCIGRLVADKQMVEAVEIVSSARAKGADLKMCIVGTSFDRRHAAHLMELQIRHQEWLNLEIDVSAKRYRELLSRCKFGIHLRSEGFGIVVAEMLNAGCLPFVSNRGGQVEILGNTSELLFSNRAEAVAAIARVAGDRALQEAIRIKLASQARLLSTDHFTAALRSIVGDVLSGERKASIR